MNNTLLNQTQQPHMQSQRDSAGSVVHQLTKAMVAELSLAEIREMSVEQLVDAIRAAQVPLFRDAVIRHLQFYDRMTLKQLVYLARRCCRNQGY